MWAMRPGQSPVEERTISCSVLRPSPPLTAAMGWGAVGRKKGQSREAGELGKGMGTGVTSTGAELPSEEEV